MRAAITHDWLVEVGGARVQAALEEFELPTVFGPSSPQLLLPASTYETPLALALSGK